MDERHTAYLHPPLTTVKVYTEQMGRMAVKVLFERKDREVPIQGLKIPIIPILEIPNKAPSIPPLYKRGMNGANLPKSEKLLDPFTRLMIWN
ncbi:hypothetical protein [Laceyella putida]|uniref:Uncharacterized protein n=1 Tax=Laceyella putida TaxID=110101 RepID=A0ABW2RQD5_9BACL